MEFEACSFCPLSWLSGVGLSAVFQLGVLGWVEMVFCTAMGTFTSNKQHDLPAFEGFGRFRRAWCVFALQKSFGSYEHDRRN